MIRIHLLALVVALSFSNLVCPTNAEGTKHLAHLCAENYDIPNSTFQNNLNTLLHSLLPSSNDTNTGFYNMYEGQGADKVNAILLCRGDISQSDCQRCVNFSTFDLRLLCPLDKEAIVWYDYCMLRYANRIIYQSLEEPSAHLWSQYNVSDVHGLNQALCSLIPRLQQLAASGDSLKKFAVGNAYYNYTNSLTVYALLQCTPDLTEEQCSDCLSQSFKYYIDSKVPERQGGRVLGPSCNFRFEVYPFYEASAPDPPSVSPPMHPSTSACSPTDDDTPKLDRSTRVQKIIFHIAVSAIFCMLMMICIITVLCLRKQNKKLEHEIGNAESLQMELGTIKSATNNFCTSNKLGQGGFGSVYKGVLADGREIAVKRLNAGSGQGDVEFTNEVVLLAKLQHKNLVSLLGFCLEGQERLLIYEFAPNASLDQILFDPEKRASLSWESRCRIIGGVARGLVYLHEDSRLRIIHRDLKPSNILLDKEMNPKLADFGMAWLCAMDQTQGNTNRIVGTYGYMAPEYVMHGQFSVKSNVFSFGVILLELVIGQKNSCFRVGKAASNLISFAWENWSSGTAINVVDPAIISGPRNELLRCVHIGLLCVQENVSARPTMGSVVMMLNSVFPSLPFPTEPALFFLRSHEEAEQAIPEEFNSGTGTQNQWSNYSTNDVSITELHPR